MKVYKFGGASVKDAAGIRNLAKIVSVESDNLSRVFHFFMVNGIKVNLVEASAVSIDVCVDDERPKVDALINDLKAEFAAVYNENVEMLSIRHYTAEALNRITNGREILLEQRTRSTVRFVVRQV